MSRIEHPDMQKVIIANKQKVLVVSSLIAIVISGILTIAVSYYFSFFTIIIAIASGSIYLIEEKKSKNRAIDIVAVHTSEKPESSPVTAPITNADDHMQMDTVLASLHEKTEKANKEFLSYFVGEKVNFDRISLECNAIAEKNENVTSKIRKINQTFAAENKIVKDLVKNVADNVDKEIASSRSTLERLERLFSFINEIIRVSGLLRTNSEFLMTLMRSLEDISERIHILSINASIIASRSGESGKAFMVVAKDERVLSDNVKKSVQNMKENSGKLARSIDEVMSNINLIDAETKTTHDAIDNLIMRFEGLNLSVSIIEKKLDSNTDILKDVEALIDENLAIARSAYNLPEKVSLENTEQMRSAIIKLLDDLIHT
jgi:methyl-accepting chemotaxis protein